jgi:hypothetical protein
VLFIIRVGFQFSAFTVDGNKVMEVARKEIFKRKKK